MSDNVHFDRTRPEKHDARHEGRAGAVVDE